MWIITPDTINNAALNKAWQSKWKKQKKTNPWLKENIIKPSWLSVEKAIIFLRSHSKLAHRPAISIVPKEITNKIQLTLTKIFSKRSKIKIPAVTKVEEWTKEDTGVGADIAAGNQEEKGIWALFLIAVNRKNTPKHKEQFFKLKNVQLPIKNIIAIDKMKNISPTRFIKKVSIPATDLEYLI